MSFRPEGWDKEIRRLLGKMPQANSTEGQIFGITCFEAGADAMLEAVCEEIEKALLTDEEIMQTLWVIFSGSSNVVSAEITLTPDDIGIANRKIAKAQLQKILDLLKE